MERTHLSSSVTVRPLSHNRYGDIALCRRQYQYPPGPVLTLTGAERENLRRWLNDNAHPDAEPARVRRT